MKIIASHNLITITIALSLLASCSSGDDKKDGKPYFKAECQGETPIISRVDGKTDKPLETGPGVVPGGKTCDDVEDMSSKELMGIKRDGLWSNFFPDSDAVLARGQYKMSKREGQWEYFDKDSGSLTKTIMFSGGKKNGPEIGYFISNKAIKYQGQNSGGKKVGQWVYNHSSTSECQSKGEYGADMKKGMWVECSMDPQSKTWYKNFEGTYKQDLRDGPAKTYNKEGNLTSEGSYEANLSPACKKDPPNGKYENCAERVGQWKFYHPNGKLATAGGYSGGKRSGKWVEYFQSGEKMAEGNRKHVRHGNWTFYTKQGQKVGTFKFDGNDFTPRYGIIYKNGVKESEGQISVGLVKYDREKDLVVIPRLMKTGNWKFFKNGRVVAEGEMVNGKKNGKWREMSGGRMETKCYMIGRPWKCD